VNILHGIGPAMNRKCIGTHFSIDSDFWPYYSRAHSGCAATRPKFFPRPSLAVRRAARQQNCVG